ncbi:hypothetical protein BH11ACT4_BH11ACT4_13080 [soil metagenome]
MSSYRSSTTTLDTSVANAVSLATAEYDALRHGVCSADIAVLAHEAAMITLQDPLSAASAWSAIDAAMPDWDVHLPATSASVVVSARAGDLPAASALASVASDLASLERLAVTDLSAASLLDLGYTVQRADGQHTSALEARKGHETFLVVVGDQGRIETDHVGLTGDVCNDRQQAFVGQMDRRGVRFDDGVTVQHHDPRGGSAVAVAARAGATNLAEGAVRAQDARPSAFITSLHESGNALAARTVAEDRA